MSKDPVPEWFGKGSAPPAPHRSAEARSSVGCAVPLAVLVLVSAAGAGAFLTMKRSPTVNVNAKPAVTAEAPVPEPVAAPVPLPPPEPVAAPAPVEPAIPEPEPSAPVVDGMERLSAAKIQLVMKGSQKRFQACYENALNYAPDAEGTVRLTLTISSTGRVTDVSTTQTGSLPPQVATCMSAITRTLKFPESPEETKVTYPFVFKAG